MNTYRPRYLALCPAEPFRIFFPLATLLGVAGVSLWPLFFSGVHQFYPGMMHARLMIQGFLGGFVIGFLGTAMPRLLSAPTLRAWELWTLIALYLTTAGLHIGHRLAAGDATFVSLLLVFATMLASRVRRRSELPPPGFMLVGLGYLAGLVGTALWFGGMNGWVPGAAMWLGGLLLNQAFVLLLILGVGSFLIPRFLELPGIVPMADERKASPAWRRRALFALTVGLVFLSSYVVEAYFNAGWIPGAMRGGIAVAYLLVMVPIHRTPEPRRTVPLAINFALAALLVGVAFPLFIPSQRVAGLHVIFIGGFSLITFTVATRVVLGHSGNEHLFRSRLPSLRLVALLVITGAVLRAVGDFFGEGRAALLETASYAWMLAALAWGVSFLPKVRIADIGEISCQSRRLRAPMIS